MGFSRVKLRNCDGLKPRDPETNPKVLAALEPLRQRLRNSASKYLRSGKLSVLEHAALKVLIGRGEAEQFISPLGKAYRMTDAASSAK